MRSPADTACTSVTASGDSFSDGLSSKISATAARLSTRASTAAYSRPLPLNSAIFSPARQRKTCRWRITLSGSATVAPQESAESAKKRGIIGKNRLI